MPEEFSPEKMFEFIKINHQYKQSLSLTAQQALYFSGKFDYYEGMIDGLKRVGISKEVIIDRCADSLSKRFFPSVKNLELEKRFYEIALEDGESHDKIHDPNDESREIYNVLLQAYERTISRLSSNIKSPESQKGNLESKTAE